MSPRKIKTIEHGKQFKPLSIRGCLWCNCGKRPIFHTTEHRIGEHCIVKYNGGVCQACVKFFKGELASRKWTRARANYLSLYPYCVECLLIDINTYGERQYTIEALRQLSSKDTFDLLATINKKHFQSADVIDHILPWRYFPDLFWNNDNWQSLCRNHHDIKTRAERL